MFRALTKLVPRRTAYPVRWFGNEPKVEGNQVKSTVSNILKEQEKKYQTPVYMRPYDKAKYEVPSTKLKVNSGFALMEIEPFPRARIMRICYNILEKIRDIPEEAMYRQYTEEKMKALMVVVDETEDVQELEKNIGTQAIELYIMELIEEMDLIDFMKVEKPWIKKKSTPKELEMLSSFDLNTKNPRYQRDPRLVHQFLETEPKAQS